MCHLQNGAATKSIADFIINWRQTPSSLKVHFSNYKLSWFNIGSVGAKADAATRVVGSMRARVCEESCSRKTASSAVRPLFATSAAVVLKLPMRRVEALRLLRGAQRRRLLFEEALLSISVNSGGLGADAPSLRRGARRRADEEHPRHYCYYLQGWCGAFPL